MLEAGFWTGVEEEKEEEEEEAKCDGVEWSLDGKVCRTYVGVKRMQEERNE